MILQKMFRRSILLLLIFYLSKSCRSCGPQDIFKRISDPESQTKPGKIRFLKNDFQNNNQTNRLTSETIYLIMQLQLIVNGNLATGLNVQKDAMEENKYVPRRALATLIGLLPRSDRVIQHFALQSK